MSVKVAIVAGAGGALGQAATVTLAAGGLTLVAVDRNERALRELPDSVHREVADTTDPAAAKSLIDRIADEIGLPDVLVNTIGTFRPGDALSTTPEMLRLTTTPTTPALVYFNGWMCDEGETQQQLLERFEGSLVGPSIRTVPYTGPDGSQGTDLFLAPEAFGEAFAADVDPETAAVMAAAQRPYAAAAFAAAPSGPLAWKTLPC